MNWQKFLITFVVIYVVGAILGFLVHMLWLAADYEALSEVWRSDMDSYMWVQWVTAAFYCFFFVFIFARGQENKGIMEGIRYGLIIWGFYNKLAVRSAAEIPCNRDEIEYVDFAIQDKV